MRRSLLVLMLALLALTACGGGDGVRERLFPPSASVQELAVQSDGRWKLKLRLQNFSNVAVRFDAIDAKLGIGGVDAGKLSLQPMLSVPPEAAEVVDAVLSPSAAAAAAVQALGAGGSSVRYTLEGTITSTEPRKRDDDFKFESQLGAVPGLAGVLR